MRLYIENNRVFAQAETVEESAQLLVLAESKKVDKQEYLPKVKKPRKKTKKQYRRDCEICGKTVKGAIGIGIHMRKMHGKLGNNAMRYGKDYDPKKKTPKAGQVLTCDYVNCDRTFRGHNALPAKLSHQRGHVNRKDVLKVDGKPVTDEKWESVPFKIG